MKYATFEKQVDAHIYKDSMEEAGNYCTTPSEVSTVRNNQIVAVWLVVCIEREDEEYLPWGLFNWQREGGTDGQS